MTEEDFKELLNNINDKVFKSCFQYQPTAVEYLEVFVSSIAVFLDLEHLTLKDTNFVNAELDAETPVRRGMGRMTDDIPRFAGKYREYVKSQGSDERQELIDGFSHLILAAYLMVECFVEAFVGRPMARHPVFAT